MHIYIYIYIYIRQGKRECRKQSLAWDRLVRCARKLVNRRRTQLWADKDYKKAWPLGRRCPIGGKTQKLNKKNTEYINEHTNKYMKLTNSKKEGARLGRDLPVEIDRKVLRRSTETLFK